MLKRFHGTLDSSGSWDEGGSATRVLMQGRVTTETAEER
jgi:hypothetical protein